MVLFAGACGSGGGSSGPPSHPTPTPSVSATGPSETVSAAPLPSRTGPLRTGPGVRPGETPPVLSESAKQHTPTGALLFADYFVRALDWSVATNDTYLLAQISAPSCTACQRDINAVVTLRREGAHERGGRTKLISSQLVAGAFKVRADYVVEIVTKDDAIVVVRPEAAPSTVAPAVARDRSFVFVSWHGGRWRVVEEAAPS